MKDRAMGENEARLGDRTNGDGARRRTAQTISNHLRPMTALRHRDQDERSAPAAWFEDFAWLSPRCGWLFSPACCCWRQPVG